MCTRRSTVRLLGLIVLIGVALLHVGAQTIAAQSYVPDTPRPQFISVSYAWMHYEPLHFARFPLEDLAGSPVGGAQGDLPYDYITRDGQTTIDVLEYSRPGRGVALAIYPFGLSVGPTLGLRASVETLPDIRVTFDGPGPLDAYAFTAGRAYDAGAAVYVADRSAGWGLGSFAFVGGGVGRIRSDLAGGTRLYAEGGGGVKSGPFGVEIAVKFGWNRLTDPVEHRFLTVPVTVRGTLSF